MQLFKVVKPMSVHTIHGEYTQLMDVYFTISDEFDYMDGFRMVIMNPSGKMSDPAIVLRRIIGFSDFYTDAPSTSDINDVVAMGLIEYVKEV